MYDWLTDALNDDSSQVITANRRLARSLVEQFDAQQIALGREAWRRPAIYSWDVWLSSLVDATRHTDDLPLRINSQQCRILWEQCLRIDVDDPLINIAGLARLCRDTWTRMHEWCVPLGECQTHATGQDQRLFARAAGRYSDELHTRHWIDDAILPSRLTELVAAGGIRLPSHLVLAGFDRMTPQATQLLDACRANGSTQATVTATQRSHAELRRYDSVEEELRAAGSWARAELDQDPTRVVAIVVSNLELDAEYSSSLLREGLTPGWQYAGDSHAAALNVSYGRKLTEYPAVHIALLILRWLYHDLRGTEVSQLLLSPFLGKGALFGRSRMELILRDLPDRNWSRALLLAELAGSEVPPDADDWVGRVSKLSETLSTLPVRARPSDWAELFDSVLAAMEWPGSSALNSDDFQLQNRWRDLLNEFARLELVSTEMRGPEAVARLTLMASETLFQAEGDGSVVSVLGPLEAAGLEFDRLWVSGLTANDWPPAGRPLVLLSRELQRSYSMPDAEPDDTARYAERVVQRLSRSAEAVLFSYPAMIGDEEQTPTALLADLTESRGDKDPGWHAITMAGSVACVDATDRVPPVLDDETVFGGAKTIDRQLSDPFAAFAFGRLGVSWLQPYQPGIAANIRGNLIHAALSRLYEGNIEHRDIIGWSDDTLSHRVEKAVAGAFRYHERHADSVLTQLLLIEKQRCRLLLQDVVAIDRERRDFSVDSVESSIQATLDPIQLKLRCDRIDRLDDGRLVILDYKTGQARRFLSSGMPAEFQLVVYACALRDPVAGLGLFNIDPRQTAIDGVGPAFDPIDDWVSLLSEWKTTVYAAARRFAAGDVGVNVKPGGRDTAALALLSRFAEIRRDV